MSNVKYFSKCKYKSKRTHHWYLTNHIEGNIYFKQEILIQKIVNPTQEH